MARTLTATWRTLYNLGGTPKFGGTVDLSEDLGGQLGGLAIDVSTVTFDKCSCASPTRIHGQRTGLVVNFTKTCMKCKAFKIPRLFGIDIFRLEKAIFRIHHEGQVSEDGSEISGTWQYKKGLSGAFLYYRIPPADEVREEDVEVKKVIPIVQAQPVGAENCLCTMR